MATKKEKEVTKANEDKVVSKEKNELNKTVKVEKKEDITYRELLDKEEALRLVCRKYETQANLSRLFIDKFQEYSKLYNKIISQIEDKINEEYF